MEEEPYWRKGGKRGVSTEAVHRDVIKLVVPYFIHITELFVLQILERRCAIKYRAYWVSRLLDLQASGLKVTGCCFSVTSILCWCQKALLLGANTGFGSEPRLKSSLTERGRHLLHQ